MCALVAFLLCPMLDTSDRVVVDRVGDEPSQEEYLAVSMVWPCSSMEAAHRQRRVVQYGDDGVVVLWRRLPVASSASL